MKFRELNRGRLAIAGSLILTLGLLPACGDDDDAPTNPGPPAPTDFPENVAVLQTGAAVGLVTAAIDELPGYADGVGAKIADEAFTYDNNEDRWEAHATFDYQGYTFEFDYYIQYLNAGNLPVEDVEDAESMTYRNEGTANYSAGNVTVHQEHSSLFTVVDLQTETLTINGRGDFTVEFTSTGEGAQSSRHEAEWEIDGDGITQPDLGCPTGSITFDMAPYQFDVTFNGTTEVQYVLRDAENDPVAGGTGTSTIDCGL